MENENKWKVIQRIKAAEPLKNGQKFASKLIAGPFTSMKDAQHWIDIHPEEGIGLAAAPIVLPPIIAGEW